jgi:hypothetical protein
MSASSVAVSLRVGFLVITLICLVGLFVRHDHAEHPLLPQFLSFSTQRAASFQTQLQPQQQGIAPSHPFQIKLNNNYVLSRYLRRQPEYGPFHNALAVVFSETIKDEPLLLTTDSIEHTMRFHSLSSISRSSAQQIWIIPNGNYAVGVGHTPEGASNHDFEITEDGRLTFNGEEKWGYCHIPETRGVALYWFGDDSIPVPKGCVSDVKLTRADYDFPAIEEQDQPVRRRVKRRFEIPRDEEYRPYA